MSCSMSVGVRVLGALGVVGILFGCEVVEGSGVVVTEERVIAGVRKLDFSGQGTVLVTQGEQESLVLEAEDNLIARLTTGVDNGRLLIAPASGVQLKPSRPIRFHLAVLDLAEIRLSGSGEVAGQSFSTGALEVELSGSGRVVLGGLTATHLEVGVSGSGQVEIAGSAEKLNVELSGSGELKASQLSVIDADVVLAGSGSVAVNVQTELSVVKSGSGSVSNLGAADVDVEVEPNAEEVAAEEPGSAVETQY